jgi:glycerol-3-phosphate dehydrogenase
MPRVKARCPDAARRGGIGGGWHGGPGSVTRDGHIRTQAVVIGGGVVGCAVLRELAMRGVEAILAEAEPDICEGASKANSAILHSGFDAHPGTTEARLLRRATELWPELLDELAVPFLRVGALMLARSVDERRRLVDNVATGASAMGVETELIDGTALGSFAPYVSPEAVAALHIPVEGVVDPFWLTRAYAEAAMTLGAVVWTSARVTALDVTVGEVRVDIGDGRRIIADQAFDCGGLLADDVARLAGDASFALRPRKGQFLVSEKTFDVERIVLPIPGPLGKGMLVTPIVFGGVLLGPTAEDIDDKLDRGTDGQARLQILAACRDLVPAVDEMDPIRQFAGVRAVSSTGDFILRPSTAGDRLFIVAGIRSTGISASPAIAEAVVADVADRRHWASAARRRGPAPTTGWAEIAGAIVCVCRSVAAAEVDAALHQASPARTVDGLKRRCGAGFGDCQGNLCLADMVDRIAAVTGNDVADVTKGPSGSWLVAGIAPVAPARPLTNRLRSAGGLPFAGDREGDRESVDVLVIGGGFAGIGAALAAADAGARVTLADRGPANGGALAGIPARLLTAEEHAALGALDDATDQGRIKLRLSATVVGLTAAAHGRTWLAEAQTAADTFEIVAGRVVMATGGYVTPREHRTIDGPRPAGVMTADFALSALGRGWRPARRAAVIGAGRLAHGVVACLEAAGVEVVGLVDVAAIRGGEAGGPADGVRGLARLEAIRLNGGRWIEVDGLILADSLRPATFLLRGLGIGDERPGVPAPVDANGALPLSGLWAVGTCVAPDVDHGTSLEAGRALGARVADPIGASGPR